MISLEQASLVYDDRGKMIHACREVSVTVNEGEFLGILGPSGSGKSSLLYLMSGLKVPTTGSVTFNGRNLNTLPDQERATIRLNQFGFVFQYPFLVGYLTALENVCIAYPEGNRQDEALRLLQEVGIGDLAHRMPHELSGGQRQRVCVARALLGSPKVVFADEPTASLDHTAGLQVMETLNTHRGSGALVVVTHDPSMLEAADRIIKIEDGAIQN
ncbi:ABC transporter ATP-binding protein [Kamptonema cortianum]|nr:ABC transporter ATP-binding protein [Geitlerinema splendidum]MDK3162437.1 ABC transporter ATP-binding protein [Kamptonema cortianum]